MKTREQKISRVTLAGALVNLVLTAGKLFAGAIAHSAAMLADGFHSLSDLVSDVVVLAFVKVSGKGRDADHPYGHGRFETFATLIVAVLLIVAAVKIGIGGVENVLKALHGEIVPMPGKLALWAAAISILAKEGMYQWTARVGRDVNAPLVTANAWHHRTDALSSVGAFLGIGAALLFGQKWAVLDSVAAVIIAAVVLVVAVKMFFPAVNELMDKSLPQEVQDEIVAIISKEEAVQNVHDLKTRRSGGTYLIDVHVVVPPEMTVLAAHDACDRIEAALRARFGAQTQISIHVEPHADSD